MSKLPTETMSKLKYLFFTLTTALLLWHCASMQKPSGGPKDKDAPKILSSFPQQGATNSSPKRIEIHFDEFFKLKNLQNELLISPPLNETPLISQKGKSLFIDLKEELNPDNTYTFNFGKGIVDFHEGNVLKDYSLVFSTGNKLDSLSLRGRVSSCPTPTMPENVIVGIYQKDSLQRDSTIYLRKPDYFALVNEGGNFQINHIRKGTFELLAFEDVNANYKYDGATEQIAFCDSLITIGDSTEIALWLFQEERELKLLESKAKKNGRIHWAFNKPINAVEIQTYPKVDFIHKIDADSLFVWPSYSKDSFYIWTNVDARLDSIWVKSDTLNKQSIEASIQSKFLKQSDLLIVQTDAPLTSVDTSQIKLFSDSTQIEYAFTQSDFELMFDFPHKENQSFNLILNKGALIDVYNNLNDSINLSLYSKVESALASLNINLDVENENYFIELLKDGIVIDKIDAGKELKFTELLPSKYQLRLTIDSNKDGKWTPGNYFDGIPPEKVFYYLEEINLRANWELEVDFLMIN